MNKFFNFIKDEEGSITAQVDFAVYCSLLTVGISTVFYIYAVKLGNVFLLASNFPSV